MEAIQQSTSQGERVGFKKNGMSAGSLEVELERLIRLMSPSSKPKMSDVLLNANIPQIVGDYSDEHGACALGVLGLESGNIKNGKVDLQGLLGYFDVSPIEMNAPAGKCDHCDEKHLTTWGMIPHLNDVHKKSFKEIGAWLQTKDL